MKYKIKQIKDIENCEYAFRHFNWVKDKIDLKDYEVVYEGELDYPKMPDELEDLFVLEELFDMFNVRRPEDFKGRSMSVSDIVEVDGDNYYCDAVGWVKFK